MPIALCRGVTLLATTVAALAIALVQPVQETGCTQTSQLALTRAFAAGIARIDRWQETTCDKAWFDGHFYSIKAPGLAAVALPSFLLLRTAHLLPESDRTTIWLLGLVTLVPAAVLLTIAVWSVAEHLLPGTGVLAAIALAVGTVALPFGTLWFGHLPAAALAFGSFALLVHGHSHASGRRLDVIAGVVGAAAVLFEYPTAVVAGGLALYAFARRGPRAGLAFLTGAAIPAIALFAYNSWAFGSPRHFSYVDTVTVTGDTGHDVIGANSAGLFGITWPSGHAFLQLMFEPRGLITLTPLCVLGGVGVVLLYRRARLESLLAGSVVAAVLVYNSGITSPFGGPFGGDSPGPRYLIVMVPFLVFPIGAAARLLPGTAVALLLTSASAMVLATATKPMVGTGETPEWLHRLGNSEFTHTVVTLLGGGSGWPAILPFAAICTALVGVAVRMSLGWSNGSVRTLFEMTAVLVAWLLLVYGSSLVYLHGRKEAGFAAFALAAATAAVGVAGRFVTGEGAGRP
ncbi:MAG: hypothetical protein ACTHKS_08065 [Gaiellaceae bacterium]